LVWVGSFTSDREQAGSAARRILLDDEAGGILMVLCRFRCSYCGNEKEDARRSVEHPLSQSLGGRGWAVREVCDDCNQFAGREVDAPFVRQPWIVWFRHRYDVLDAQRRVPAAPRVVGRLKSSGERVLTVMARGGWYTEPLPQGYTAHGPGPVREELGPEVVLEGTTKRLIEHPEVEVEWTHDPTLWPRLGAKLGLGFGRELLGASWLDSPCARYLQAVLFSREPSPPASHARLATASETVAGSELADLFVPPDHVVWVSNSEHGATLNVVLFGDQRYTVPLGGAVAPEVSATWVFDTSRHLAERLSWRSYAERMALRLPL
jgi:hypothetical protein